MDHSRASSVYSTDLSRDGSSASRQPTYLNYSSSVRTNSSERFKAAREYAESLGQMPATRAPTREPSRTLPSGSTHAPSSSVSTVTSSSHAPSSSASTISYTTQPAYEHEEEAPSSIQATPASSRPSSRPSVKPSFMNYQGGAPAQAAAAAAVPQPVVRKPVAASNGNGIPAPPSGLLLLFLAAEVPKETIYYLEILLKKRTFSGLAIVGLQEQEAAVKQVKVETYGLIGKLEKEMSVQTYLQADWNVETIAEVVQKATKAGDSVSGVLYSMSYETAETAAEDVLSLDNAVLLQSWQRSVGYLHAIAKTTVPLMTAGGRRSESSVFLNLDVQDGSPAAAMSRAACDTLLRQLSAAYRGLTVDSAKNVLIPEPEPRKTNGMTPVRIPRNNYSYDEPAFEPSESPTKLWGMWALQDQLGVAD